MRGAMYPHPMQVTHHAHPDTRRDTNCSTGKNHWWRYIDKNWNNTGILVINVPIHILAKTIKQLPDQTEERDNRHRILWSAIGWVINKDVHKINKCLKYTNDISFIRLDKTKLHQVERLIPPMLEVNSLEINKSITEKYIIGVKKRNDDSYKKC